MPKNIQHLNPDTVDELSSNKANEDKNSQRKNVRGTWEVGYRIKKQSLLHQLDVPFCH